MDKKVIVLDAGYSSRRMLRAALVAAGVHVIMARECPPIPDPIWNLKATFRAPVAGPEGAPPPKGSKGKPRHW